MIWNFIQNEILGMQWLNRGIGLLLSLVGLDPGNRIGSSIRFFLYDTVKIMVLLGVLILLIASVGRVLRPAEIQDLIEKCC